MTKRFYVVLCAFSVGCTSSDLKKEELKEQLTTPTLFVHVADLSKSTTRLTVYNDTAIARSIYYMLASQGSGTIKVVYITANSLSEEVVTIPVLSLDTTNVDTIHNSYLRSKALRANKAAKDNFNRQAEDNIQRYIATISKPHDQEYSDVRNALSMVSIICRQSIFQNHRKFVGLFSDIKQDAAGQGNNKLQPVQFDDATVLCVRPALSPEQLNILFSQNVEVLTSSQDILPFIQFHQLH